MRKQTLFFSLFLLVLLLTLALSSCSKRVDLDNTPRGNMEALWKMIDEHYCFFEYKRVDWDSVHAVFMPRVQNTIGSVSLLKLMDEMLDLLQDGHVNVYASFDVARYWQWYEDYPANFDEAIQKNYLGDDYFLSGSIRYKVLDDNIGYIYLPSFANPISRYSMDYALDVLSFCQGIILDIRNNGGGYITNVQTIASCFTTQKRLTGYICHKTGRGHSDFSEPYPFYLYPRSESEHNYYKPVAVLTNRHCFSAANDFVNTMRQIPTVQIIGDKTGGGSGLPFSAELPNGWSVRFSTSPSFGPNMEQIEFGIEPHVRVDMTDEDKAKGLDTIIEEARKQLKRAYEEGF